MAQEISPIPPAAQVDAAEQSPEVLLVDNGSLRAEATLSLRRLAARLSQQIARKVHPVSLLHSSRVPAAELNGQRAEILEPYLLRRLRKGQERFTILPLFFGPSGAIVDYIPQRLAALREKYPLLEVTLAQPLAGATVHTPDPRLTEALARAVTEVIEDKCLESPPVVLVDHGSPLEALATLRNQLADALAERLGPAVASVTASSMERRDGPEYAFNEPLLENALTLPPHRGRTVILSMLFLNPGRHAGEGGDIDQIVDGVRTQDSQLGVVRTRLLAGDDALRSILADRLTEAESGAARLPAGVS
ncbi:MAG: sirohydrochlorin chelatase [Opitutales bacterium]